MNPDLFFIISGGSMHPLLKKHEDAIIITCCTYEEVKKNDLIVFYKNNCVSEFTCHRVYNIVDGILYEKGDHSFGINMVEREDFIGKVSFIIKKGHSYSLADKHNAFLNKIIGFLCHLYNIKIKLYLFIHPNVTEEMMLSDK